MEPITVIILRFETKSSSYKGHASGMNEEKNLAPRSMIAEQGGG